MSRDIPMVDVGHLGAFDADGALAESADRLNQLNRKGFVQEHEDTHVTALRKAAGSAAVKKPSFDFKGTTSSQPTFQQTAIVLEDTGVRAYQGQAANIKTPAILRAAISIHPVEARHASWIRLVAGMPPAPDAFNPADDMATVLAAVQGTGFITTAASATSGSSVSGTPAMTG